MTTPCSQCATLLDARWNFCPHCGAARTHEIPPQTLPTEPRKTPAGSAFGGLFFGFIAAPVCIIVGIMLCCTGLGAIAGMPLILLGICAPLIGPLLALGELRGKCPWCGAAINSIINHKDAFFCHACSGKIAVHDHELVKAA